MNDQYNMNYYEPTPPVKAPSAVAVMVLGIIAAALAETGIPAIILGAIALSKSNKYLAVYGQTNGKIIAGRITGRLGLIFGIICTVIWAIYIFVIVIYVMGFISLYNGYSNDIFDFYSNLIIRCAGII